MSFVADRRGRVPFAFIGALLLLTSSLYVVSLTPPPASEPIAEELSTDAKLEARLALDAAIRDADRRAGENPVLEPSESGIGAVISESDPHKSALKLRIASGARRALNGTTTSRDGVTARVSMPSITDQESARQAIENVSIRQVSPKRYRVRIEGIAIEVTRHERPVDRSVYNATVTTALPSLELHERTTRYERRVNADLTEPGLSRDITARLFPIVWMRGYAQYGGAPIQNVLANRHVEVMANDALLAQQAAVFGTEDPAGRNATRQAAADVATRDLFKGAEETVKAQLSSPQGERTGAGEPSGAPNVPVPSVVDSKQTVDANHTVDAVYLDYLEGTDGRSLEETVDAVYRAAVRLDSASTRIDTEREEFGTRPENGTYLFDYSNTERWLAGGEWHDGHGSTLRTYRGRVVEETVTTDYWAGNNTLATTQTVVRRTYRVRLSLRYRYRPPGIAPDRPISHDPFGAEAQDRLRSAGTDAVLANGGVEERTVAAVQGSGGTSWKTVDIEAPPAVLEQVTRETAALRKETRTTSVTVETRSVASSANPATELASAIRSDRDQLLDPPTRYDGVADRAEAAARQRYLERVTDRLDSRTPMIHRAQNALSDRLASQMVPTEAPARSTPAEESYVADVDGGPVYLSADPPDGSEPPLSARNVNLFTVPYGDAADAVADSVDAGQTGASMRTAAQTLAVLGKRGVGDTHDRRRLRRDLRDAVGAAADEYRSVLSPAVGVERADRLVRNAVQEQPNLAARALAVSNGELARSIAADLPRDLSQTERDRLRVALRVATTEQRNDRELQVSESLVDEARQSVESGAAPLVSESWKAAGTEAGKAAWEKGTGESVGSLPAGLPLLPMPSAWYATANAWTVSVEGEYERFTVSTRRAAPGRESDGTVEYVREADVVAADIDTDGIDERLGRNEPVAFSARTGVVIVVPPGGTGVGDVDGQAIETTRGW